MRLTHFGVQFSEFWTQSSGHPRSMMQKSSFNLEDSPLPLGSVPSFPRPLATTGLFSVPILRQRTESYSVELFESGFFRGAQCIGVSSVVVSIVEDFVNHHTVFHRMDVLLVHSPAEGPLVVFIIWQ